MRGYGMNAGIADAANLSWMIAATLNGWAPPAILDAYEAERQPITEQVSRFTMDIALKIMKQRREIPAEIESPGPVGERSARALARRPTTSTSSNNAAAASISAISTGAHRSSPMTASRTLPTRCMTSRRRPFPAAGHHTCGSSDGRSLYDALGPDYTLVRIDPTVRVQGIVEAAAARGVPLAVLDMDAPDARALYARKLVLVRPDQHVAWRGDEEPAAPLDLRDLVRGARPIPTESWGDQSMPTIRRRGASLLVPPRSDAGTHPSAGPPGHALPVDVSELKLVAAGVVVELDLDVADRSRVLGGDEYLGSRTGPCRRRSSAASSGTCATG